MAKPAKSTPKKSASAGKPKPEKRRLWLTFGGESTTKPLIWQMSRRFDLIFNIRNSSVTDAIGLIALELEGDSKTIDAAVQWFRKNGVQVDPVEMNTIEG
jgi:ABC-type methionine transport system ATPase subunit